ncbi:MAG TPA: NAD(P)-dependent oxidoreductase [Solirubrobacteraceae bacterium]|nr:NAD(P)-dependent oxidoreductase [Solirubrobacteraceae bacterium]
MSRVLVTGAGGFIGRRVVDRLLADGHEVHGVCTGHGGSRDTRVVWHRADLLAPEAADAVTGEAQATHLLHLAWYAFPGRFWSAVENIEWISATLRLLHSFAAAGGHRAVVAGTCAEYAWGEDVLREEDTPLAPATLYGVCKHATQVAASALSEQLDLSFAWGRIFFLYGPGEDSQRLVASIARGLLTGQRVASTEGSQVRDFLHVDDIAGAFAALVASDVQGPVNIASGQPVAVRAIVEEIGRATDRLDHVDFGALTLRDGDPPRIVADVVRLREEVGFSARIGLAEGIRGTIEWWRQHVDGDGEVA